MEVGVLGATQVRRGNGVVDIGTRKQRALLAALAMHRGRAVPVDLIVDLLWGDEPPPSVAATLQAYVSGLRRALEPERERRAPATTLVTIGAGYALQVEPDQLDASRFAAAVNSQHRRLGPGAGLLAPTSLSRTELDATLTALDESLTLWRGEPYLELDETPDALAERARLAELRLIALEDRAVVGLALGQHATVAAELDPLTAAYPLRERLWGLRAIALTRCGRQAEALEVIQAVRDVLDDELGLELSTELRTLQTAVLRQDPELAWTPPAGSESVTVKPAPAAPPPPVTGGPMVGRAEPLAALVGLLEDADQGHTQYASIVGEPGIGKTRLAAELMAVARARGVRVLAGRCSQDDGAPPLWPWAAVLAGIGQELPTAAADDPGAQFRVWDGIAAAVFGAAAEATTLVVLDDLHWADPSTLRVLRLMVETPTDARLLVVGTRREFPEPTGALADVVEMLARRHALRVRLTGLTAPETADVVERVVKDRPSAAAAADLRARTDGNPFFLVEFARLAAERGDLAGLLAEDRPPTAVSEVLVRRVDRLPEPTRAVLRTAAVIGRQFDLGTLARTTGEPVDVLFDQLEPAQLAGLVKEEAIDEFTFAHALVRDTLYAGWSPSRRARAHARVATALSDGREIERARHWLAAGPPYAAQAWRAAAAGADLARRLHAHEQSAELLRAALDRLTQDAEAEPGQRYDLLMRLADAYRWIGRWPELTACVEEAIEVAVLLGDIERVAQAAISTTVGALWQSAEPGEIHAGVVAALRQCLDQLPADDSPLRCRVLLSLANETYWASGYAERRALVDDALAMADRLDDPEVQLDAHQIAFAALWCPRTAEERLGHTVEAMRLARELGREQAFVVSVALRAVVEAELGLVDAMRESVALTRREAARLRMPYGLLVVESLELPWLAMAGRFDEGEARVAEIARLDAQMSLQQSDDAVGSALIALDTWRGRTAGVAQLLAQMDEGPMPISAVVAAMMLRAGALDEARDYVAHHPIDLETENWVSLLNWCHAGEVALWLDDAELAGRASAKLAPYAGYSCCAGSANASGPADAFLALAARARGEGALATEHADRAEELMGEWGIPQAAQWLRGLRDRFGF